jgi:hypothetical protein
MVVHSFRCTEFVTAHTTRRVSIVKNVKICIMITLGGLQNWADLMNVKVSSLIYFMQLKTLSFLLPLPSFYHPFHCPIQYFFNIRARLPSSPICLSVLSFLTSSSLLAFPPPYILSCSPSLHFSPLHLSPLTAFINQIILGAHFLSFSRV